MKNDDLTQEAQNSSRVDASSSVTSPGGTEVGNGSSGVDGDRDPVPFGTDPDADSHVDGDRDPVAFGLKPNADDMATREPYQFSPEDLDGFTLARLDTVCAFRYETALIIYAMGFSDGYGGRLVIQERPERIYPQLFHVYALPGNGGINPDASPRDVPTIAACSFDPSGVGDKILVQGRDERKEVEVIQVKPGVRRS